MSLLSEQERDFLSRRRVGRLATANLAAVPHVVPVCFALDGDVIYIAVDEKPKRGTQLQRLRNIAQNAVVTFLADRYDDDWSRLGWLMLEGRAEILNEGLEFNNAERLLRNRYSQYSAMKLFPIIAIRLSRARAWGKLDD